MQVGAVVGREEERKRKTRDGEDSPHPPRGEKKETTLFFYTKAFISFSSYIFFEKVFWPVQSNAHLGRKLTEPAMLTMLPGLFLFSAHISQ